MLTAADIEAVTEFTRVASVFHPRLRWEQLETEAGTIYLHVSRYEGDVSWSIEQCPEGGWVVYGARRYGHGNEFLASGDSPAEALRQLVRTDRETMEGVS